MKRYATLLTVCAMVCATSPAVRGDEVTDWSQIFLNSAIAANTAPYDHAVFCHCTTAVSDAVNGIRQVRQCTFCPASLRDLDAGGRRRSGLHRAGQPYPTEDLADASLFITR